MKCSTCHRWYHGECDSIQNEADAEKCAEETYECPFCRPEDALPPHLIGNYSLFISIPCIVNKVYFSKCEVPD